MWTHGSDSDADMATPSQWSSGLWPTGRPSDETFFQSRISPKCLTLREGGQALNLRLPESLYPGARALPMDRPHVFVCHLQEG